MAINVYLSIAMQNRIRTIQQACSEGFEGPDGETVSVDWTPADVVQLALANLGLLAENEPEQVAESCYQLRANGELG